MRKHTFFLFFSFLAVPILAFADLGPKPHLDLTITYQGKPIDQQVLICTDTMQPAIRTDLEQQVEALIAEKVPSFRKEMCYTCNAGETCSQWFYGSPREAIVVYPIQLLAAEEGSRPKVSLLATSAVYGPINIESLGGFNKVAAITLQQDGKVTLTNQVPFFWSPYVRFFIAALLATLCLEGSFILLVLGLLRKPWRKVIPTVVWMNVLTLPFVWFIIPLIVRDLFISLAIAEVVVVIIEAMILRWRHGDIFSLLGAILMSIFANFLSFSAGLIIGVIILFAG